MDSLKSRLARDEEGIHQLGYRATVNTQNTPEKVKK